MVKILLADDEEAITSELGPFLERCGFEVVVARSGDETLRKVESFQPHLVVLDILMPGPNGREVCRRLRASGNWTPVIMLTTEGQDAKKEQGRAAGAKAWIVKPFNPPQLLDAVSKLILP